METVYDFGANVGNNIPYYLLKGYRVVAVEANPNLCQELRSRFSGEIGRGHVSVENLAVVEKSRTGSPIQFHVHRTKSVLSSVDLKSTDDANSFDLVEVEAATAADIIDRHGAPFFVKIDLEGSDDVCLRSVISTGLLPKYMSVEAHTIDVFATLLAIGGYRAFKIVDGATVGERYSDARIITPDGLAPYSFPTHSAGPFGNDLPGQWMTAASLLSSLASTGFGWKDIHVSLLDAATDDSRTPFEYEPKVSGAIEVLIAALARSIKFRLSRLR